MAQVQTEDELAQAVRRDLEAAQNVADLRPQAKGTSVAEQMVGIANVIRGVHQEIDKLEADVIARLGVIRKTLGGKA